MQLRLRLANAGGRWSSGPEKDDSLVAISGASLADQLMPFGSTRQTSARDKAGHSRAWQLLDRLGRSEGGILYRSKRVPEQW